MPELPEVEIWRENLERWLKGRRIQRASVPDALLRGRQSRRKVEAGLEGARVRGVERRGKFLVLDLGRARSSVLVHLGMTGTFERVTPKAKLPKFTRATLELARGERIAFVDVRRLGEFRLVTEQEKKRLAALGVEPLDREFTPARLYELVQKSARPIKIFLMDQKRIAGIGNIHAAEALFLAGIHPERSASGLTPEESALLARSIRRELRAEIARSRSDKLRYLQQANRTGSECTGTRMNRARDVARRLRNSSTEADPATIALSANRKGNDMKRENLSLSTRAIHSGASGERKNRPVAPPIYLSVTFESKDVDEQVALEESKADMFYTRYGNPTLTIAERTVAELEGAESAAVFGSGMAAITTTLLAHLQRGDHAVFQREVYGGVHRFAYELLPRYGVDVSWFEATDVSGFESAIRDNTKVVYVESPTNPTLKLVDIARVTAVAKARGIVSLIDSTFATPLNTQPHTLGVDGVLHSATKYLSGHSDLLGGVVTGSRDLVDRVKSFMRVLGGILDPHAGYLLIRGMKSLGLRVGRHNDNGVAVSRFLEGHENVRAVYYPMLESHPQHELALRQMRGGGGVVSFEVDGGLAHAKQLVNALSIVRVAPSLGGVESLISIPCLTSHAMLSREEREKAGISDGLIRLALGIEDAEDLIADLEEALATL